MHSVPDSLREGERSTCKMWSREKCQDMTEMNYGRGFEWSLEASGWFIDDTRWKRILRGSKRAEWKVWHFARLEAVSSRVAIFNCILWFVDYSIKILYLFSYDRFLQAFPFFRITDHPESYRSSGISGLSSVCYSKNILMDCDLLIELKHWGIYCKYIIIFISCTSESKHKNGKLHQIQNMLYRKCINWILKFYLIRYIFLIYFQQFFTVKSWIFLYSEMI